MATIMAIMGILKVQQPRFYWTKARWYDHASMEECQENSAKEFDHWSEVDIFTSWFSMEIFICKSMKSCENSFFSHEVLWKLAFWRTAVYAGNLDLTLKNRMLFPRSERQMLSDDTYDNFTSIFWSWIIGTKFDGGNFTFVKFWSCSFHKKINLLRCATTLNFLQFSMLAYQYLKAFKMNRFYILIM